MIARTCPQGHRIPGGAKVCPTCGWGAKKPRPDVPEAQRESYRKGYKSSEYRKNRLLRISIAHNACERCCLPVKPGQFECHHVVALRDGGTDDVRNLRILCTVPPNNCHKAVTREYRRQRRRA